MKNTNPISSTLPTAQYCATGLPLCLVWVFNMQEIWKDVEGFEGYYKISNFGRLKSFKVYPEGYVLKQTNKKGWYFTVNLKDDLRMVTTRIHRLVAKHFIPNPENKRDVNHKDCNKQNNHVENLEWVTSSENSIHAVKHTNVMSGFNKYNQDTKLKFIAQCDITTGKEIQVFKGGKAASDATGVCQRNILQVAGKTPYGPNNLTRKQAGGFIWRYVK